MRTRPVAASDYWLTSRLRAFIGREVFRAVLINRNPAERTEDPVAQMVEALDTGVSLILFPEGKRNSGPEPLLPFKSGPYHLAQERPAIDLVPVWIENLNRVMPKGEVIPDPAERDHHLRPRAASRRRRAEAGIPRARGSGASRPARASESPAMTQPPAHLAIVLVALGALTIVATVIGRLLQRRYSPDRTNVAIENLNDRIRSWWVMIVLMGLALVFGKAGATVLFAFCSFAALREVMTLTETRRADHWAVAAAFFVVLPVQYYLIWTEWYGLYSILIPVYAFLLIPVLAVLRGETAGFLVRIAGVQWALMICVYCISHVPALLSLHIPGYQGRNVLLIAFLIIVAQSSDVAQYVWGKLIGRTAIAPNVSPSKTVEGLVGGGLTAVLIGAGLWWITPFSPLQAGALAAVIVVMGFAGGLVMSAIKRDRGVKDWGHLIAGHGGMTDRLDSVIFSAPIFFHLVRHGWSLT